MRGSVFRPPHPATRLLHLRELLVQHILVQRFVLGLCSEGLLVLQHLLGVLQTDARSLYCRLEDIAPLLLGVGDGGGALSVANGVLGVPSMREADGGVFADFAADILDRILVSNFTHSGFLVVSGQWLVVSGGIKN